MKLSLMKIMHLKNWQERKEVSFQCQKKREYLAYCSSYIAIMASTQAAGNSQTVWLKRNKSQNQSLNLFNIVCMALKANFRTHVIEEKMLTQEVLSDFKDEKQDRKLKKCRKQRRQRSSKKSRRLRKLDRECRYNSK